MPMTRHLGTAARWQASGLPGQQRDLRSEVGAPESRLRAVQRDRDGTEQRTRTEPEADACPRTDRLANRQVDAETRGPSHTLVRDPVDARASAHVDEREGQKATELAAPGRSELWGPIDSGVRIEPRRQGRLGARDRPLVD